MSDNMPTCNVCEERPGVGVFSSPLGAISFSYCGECLRMHAEPAVMFQYVYEMTGKGEEAADWVKEMRTYLKKPHDAEGRYVTWDEFVTLVGTLNG